MQENIKKLRQLTGAKPRANLGFYPTPFYKLERLSGQLGVELYIKRDDFSGMSLFGGNKVRKLEYLMGDALAQGSETVVTYGATQSNHAMQTATACRRLGLHPILYLNAYVNPDENDIRANMLLDRILGAEMHVIQSEPGETEQQTEQRCFQTGKEHVARMRQAGHKCYDVPMGGSSHVGAAAFADGYAELMEQCQQAGVSPRYVFCATGSGGTQAGLVAGHHLVGDQAQVVGIAVSRKNDEYEAYCAELCNKALAWLGSDARVSAADFTVDRGYYLPGYEQPSEAASDAIRLLARTEGLMLDPVYTGKAFAGLLDWVKQGKVKPGDTVVFWHTGGATALFSEKEIVGSINQEG